MLRPQPTKPTARSTWAKRVCVLVRAIHGKSPTVQPKLVFILSRNQPPHFRTKYAWLVSQRHPQGYTLADHLSTDLHQLRDNPGGPKRGQSYRFYTGMLVSLDDNNSSPPFAV